MPFTLPNEASAGFGGQAEIDAVDIDILVAGMKGDGIITGCAVTAQGSPDMTLAVAAGSVLIGKVPANVAAGNVTITTAHATNPRYDLVVVDNTGAKSVTAGTAAASPIFPAIPANSVVLAAVYVPANDTAINSNQITDKRVIVPGNALIRKASTETVNNSSALQDDDELKLQILGGDVWAFELGLLTTAVNTTADWQFAWSVPAAATMLWGAHQQGSSLILDAPGTGTAQQAANTESTTLTMGSAGVSGLTIFKGVIRGGGTAGTVQFRWAQNVANATNSQVNSDSYIRAWKLL